jgi:DNA-binding CsgD family transcriptional regulator
MLTEREMEVAKAVTRGMTSIEVAKQFGLSVHTVRNHRKNIMKKLGVRKSAAWYMKLQRGANKMSTI